MSHWPLSLEITPNTPADRQKLARALQVLATEDAHLGVRPGDEPDCVVIGAASEAHLEEIIDRLKREFAVGGSLGKPTVAYRETLTRSAEGSAKHVTMVHGRREFAHVCLRLNPREAGSGYCFTGTTTGGAIPKRFMTSIDAGIRESMAHGVLRGYPIVDLQVEVHDGPYHDTDSTESAFRTAAAMAFHLAAENAEPVVMEPVMHVVVKTDNRHVNAVLDSLRMRRGRILARTHDADEEVVTARVPLAELFGFQGQVRAETHGHGSCSIQFACYQPMVQDPGGEDDYPSHVGAPHRPAPHLRSRAASVPEPQ